MSATVVFNHFGITVSDLAASVGFYRDVVGMDTDWTPGGGTVSGDWFDTLTHNQGAVLRGAHMSLPGMRLQLLEYIEAGNPEAVSGHNRVGNVHMALNIPDIDVKREEIVALGKYDPTPIVNLPMPGWRSFYIADPDGVPVEFQQPPPGQGGL